MQREGVLDPLLTEEIDYASLPPDLWAKTHPEDFREYAGRRSAGL